MTDLIPESMKEEFAKSLVDLLRSTAGLVTTIASLPSDIVRGLQNLHAKFYSIPYVEGAEMPKYEDDFDLSTLTTQQMRDQYKNYAISVMNLLIIEKNKNTKLLTACKAAIDSLESEKAGRARRLQNANTKYNKLLEERYQLESQNIYGEHLEERADNINSNLTRLKGQVEVDKKRLEKAKRERDTKKIQLLEAQIASGEKTIRKVEANLPQTRTSETEAKNARVLPGIGKTIENYDDEIATTLETIRDIKNEKSYFPEVLRTFLLDNKYITDDDAAGYEEVEAQYDDVYKMVVDIQKAAIKSEKEIGKDIHACEVVLAGIGREENDEKNKSAQPQSKSN